MTGGRNILYFRFKKNHSMQESPTSCRHCVAISLVVSGVVPVGPSRVWLGVLTLLLLALSGGGAIAQGTSTSPGPGTAPSGAGAAARAAEDRSGPARSSAAALGPLTLEEAVNTALGKNPNITIAVGNQLAAIARIWEARSAWLPVLSVGATGNGRYTYQTGEPVYGADTTCTQGLQPEVGINLKCGAPANVINPAYGGKPNLQYIAQFQLSQQLNDFGRTNGAIDQNKAQARATNGDRETARQQIAVTAMTAFYSALQADALYDVAVDNLKQQEQKLRQAEGFYHIGTHPEIDVLTARTGRAQAQLQLAQARTGIQNARALLLLALGVTDPAWLSRKLVPIERARLAVESRTVDDLLDEVLKKRPDYIAQRDRVEAAEQTVRLTRANYFPQLNFTGSLTANGQHGVAISSSGSLANPVTNGMPLLAASGSIVFSWTFFDGLLTPSTVKEKEGLLIAARATLESIRQQVRSGLLQALMGVEAARESLTAADVVLQQAELQLRSATGRYEKGVGTIIELGDAQVAATTARSQRVQAEYALDSARATLLQQLGEVVAPEPLGKQGHP
jgi:outer membrane protein